MTSLRRRLYASLAIGNALLALGVALTLWQAARTVARSQLDQSLEAQIRTLANMCRTDEKGETYLDVDPQVMPWYEPGPACQYFRLRREDGSILQLSSSLGGLWGLPKGTQPALDPGLGASALPDLSTVVGVVSFADAILPDGRPGRAVGLRTRALPDWDPDAPPRPLPTLHVLDLVIARDRTPEQQMLGTILPVGLLLVLAWPSAAAVFAWWMIRRGLRPLSELGRELEKLDPVRPGERARSGAKIRELAPIVDRVNGLMARAEAALARERRFAGMAAHELRTPLAGLAAAMEVAGGWPDDREAQTRLAQDGLREVRRMQARVDGLLLIARSQSVGELRPVEVRAALGEAIRRQEGALAERGIQLKIEAAAVAIVAGTDGMIEAILANLIGNLVAHAPAGCEVTCDLAAIAEGWQLTIANPAPGLTALEVQRLAEPWFRPGSGTGQAGLGLAIASAATQAIGGTMTCHLEGDRLVIRVDFRRG